MNEKEKEILEKLSKIIPKMSDSQKNYFIGVADGMAMMKTKEDVKGA